MRAATAVVGSQRRSGVAACCARNVASRQRLPSTRHKLVSRGCCSAASYIAGIAVLAAGAAIHRFGRAAVPYSPDLGHMGRHRAMKAGADRCRTVPALMIQ